MKTTTTLFKELTTVNNPEDLVDLNNLPTIHPEWLRGFTDAEGSFYIAVRETTTKAKYRIEPTFFIKQEKASASTLFAIRKFFDKGNIRWDDADKKYLRYEIKSVSAIQEKVVTFFDKYPLLSSKRLNFLDLKKVLGLVQLKSHLNPSGIEKIKEIKSRMNSKRSFEDKVKFMNSISESIRITPGWLSGFIDGEGHFGFYVSNESRRRCESRFSISQNAHDLVLLEAIAKFLGADNKIIGNTRPDDTVKQLTIYNLDCLLNRVLPIFEEYPLITNKHTDFVVWK
jgi:LAGLIDADG endonuclease